MAAACGSSSPTATLVSDAAQAQYTEGGDHLSVNDVVWIGLPLLTVQGKATLRVVSVKFARYPDEGLSTPQFFRVLFATTGHELAIVTDRDFRRFGFSVDGPYSGTMLSAGEPTSFGVAKVAVEARGTYRISDVVVRYAEPDGSTRTQTFHINVVLGARGG